MKKVGQFEKVSVEQFSLAARELFDEAAKKPTWKELLARLRGADRMAAIYWIDSSLCNKTPDWEGWSKEQVEKMYDLLTPPKRATTKSAGHDFLSPFDFTLEPGATIKIPTGIRVKIEEGWWLACMPRSSLGFKYRAQLDNTVGVIDGDYYHSDNEGHIFLKVTNDSRNGKTMAVKRGEGIMQGIFLPYGVTHEDAVTAVRNGGFGSTG